MNKLNIKVGDILQYIESLKEHCCVYKLRVTKIPKVSSRCIEYDIIESGNDSKGSKPVFQLDYMQDSKLWIIITPSIFERVIDKYGL